MPPSMEDSLYYVLEREEPFSDLHCNMTDVKVQGRYSLPDDVHSAVFSGLQLGYLEDITFGYGCCKDLHTVTFASMIASYT